MSLEGDVYRRSSGPERELPPVRAATPRPLTDVMAALARLSPRPGRNQFEVLGLVVRVPDPHAVDPSTMILEGARPEDAIDVAYALVSLFGPLAVGFGWTGWVVVVDGTRPVGALRREVSDRYDAIQNHPFFRVATELEDFLSAAFPRKKPR